MKGLVYLVGAGPGDPALLTLRGRECIAQADVVIHDYLVDPRLLRYARPQAEVVSSGKSGDASERDRQQRAINERMIAAALAGKVVVRLKGGDPFVFGRGSEEAQALVDAGIRFEIVPGVSSAIAVPAYAGIPVTERGLNSSFTVITGHEAPNAARLLDWQALARMDTLIFLMGLRMIATIAARLREAGMRPDTPAACVRSGTRPAQQTIVGTLADIADSVERAGFEPPAILVVGEVVKRRARLSWFEQRPLLGRRIVVTRAKGQAEALSEKLRSLGAGVIELPTIEIRPAADYTLLDRAIATLSCYDWLIFTSANGVRFFVDRLDRSGTDLRALRARICAIGPATRAAVEALHLKVDLMGKEYVAEGLLEAFAAHDLAGKRVLLPRAAVARDLVPVELTRRGAQVDVVEAYRTVIPDDGAAHVYDLFSSPHKPDCITFTSSSTVQNFVSMAGTEVLEDVSVVSIGPVTSKTARELRLRVDAEAQPYTIDGLVAAILERFGRAHETRGV